MPRDIEYWKDEEAEMILVEPKTVKGRALMVEEFPIYSKAKHYRAYLANNGSMCWEFPSDSPALNAFLEANCGSAAQVAA